MAAKKPIGQPRHLGRTVLSSEVAATVPLGNEAVDSQIARDRYLDRKSPEIQTDYATYQARAIAGDFVDRIPGELLPIGDPAVLWAVSATSIQRTIPSATAILQGSGSRSFILSSGQQARLGVDVGPDLSLVTTIPSQWEADPSPVPAWEYEADAPGTGTWQLNKWPSVPFVLAVFGLSVPAANLQFQLYWYKETSVNVYTTEVTKSPVWQLDVTGSPQLMAVPLLGGANVLNAGQKSRLMLRRVDAGANANVTVSDTSILVFTLGLG